MDTEWILYLVIAFASIIGILYGAHFIKNEKAKNLLLIFFALFCFGVHISNIYTEFLAHRNGLSNYHLFPIYFCNYMMNLLVVTALWPYKNNKTFRCLATFVAWGSIFGGLITNFTEPPRIANWINFKSTLSHTAMILTGAYLFVGGFAKLNVYNLVPFSFGLLSAGGFGVLTEIVFRTHGFGSPNAMYLFSGPSGFEAFNAWVLAPLLLLIIFVFTMIWEFFTKKKEDRWYKTINDLRLYVKPISFKKKQKNVKIEKIEKETKQPKEKKQEEDFDIQESGI